MTMIPRQYLWVLNKYSYRCFGVEEMPSERLNSLFDGMFFGCCIVVVFTQNSMLEIAHVLQLLISE